MKSLVGIQGQGKVKDVGLHGLAWPPRAQPSPAPDRVAIDPQLARRALDLVAPGRPGQDLSHFIPSQHRVLPLCQHE